MKNGNLRVRVCALFFFVCVSFLLRSSVHAASGLVLDEIMYDPAGSDTNREWVEVYNSSAAPIDLAGHFFLTDGLASSHHALTPETASSIPAGGFAVIVQNVAAFKTDYPAYSGLVFDSSWSGLTTTAGKMLAIIDSGGAVLDQVTYDPTIGGANDGNSLQRTAGGTWIAASPTPGAAVAISDTDASSNAGTNGGTSADTGNTTEASGGTLSAGSTAASLHTEKAPAPKAPPVLTTSLTIPKNGTTNIPVSITASTLDPSGVSRTYGTAHIAFGDGSFFDGSPNAATTHVYRYSGKYVVTLQYRANQYAPDINASSRSVIEIALPTVVISHIDPDGSIELSNQGKFDADISGWSIASAAPTESFVVPIGTIILAGETVVFPRDVIHLALSSDAVATLLLPSGVVSSSFGETAEETPPLVQ